MPADYSYQPVGLMPDASAFLENVNVAPLDRTWPAAPTVQGGLQNYYGTRQAVRQDRAATDQERLRQATIRAAGPGSTAFDMADLEEYRQRFGSLPMDPITGQVNMQEVRTRLTNQKQLEQALAIQTAGVGGTAGILKPEERIKLEENLQRIQESKSKGQEAIALVSDTSKNVVGPGTGRAGPLYQLGTLFGIDVAEERFNDQRVLQQIVSENILKAAENMKGQLSDRDVKFLQAAVPKLTDTEEVWKRYFARWNAMMDEAERRTVALLNGQIAPGQAQAPIVSEQEFAAAQQNAAEKAAAGEYVGGAAPAAQAATYDVDAQGNIIQFNPDGTQKVMTSEELDAISAQQLQAAPPPAPAAPAVQGVNPQAPLQNQILQRTGQELFKIGPPVINPVRQYNYLRDVYRLLNRPAPAQPTMRIQSGVRG